MKKSGRGVDLCNTGPMSPAQAILRLLYYSPRRLESKTLTLNRTSSLDEGDGKRPKTKTDTLQVKVEDEEEGGYEEETEELLGPATTGVYTSLPEALNQQFNFVESKKTNEDLARNTTGVTLGKLKSQ